MNRTTKILLTISLLLNVLLAGYAGSMTYKKYRMDSWHKAGDLLEPESRHLVARHLQQSRREMKETFEKMRATRTEIDALMQAEKFDEKKFDELSKTLLDTQGEMMKNRVETMKKIALELPVEERKKFSAHFIKSLGRGGKFSFSHEKEPYGPYLRQGPPAPPEAAKP